MVILLRVLFRIFAFTIFVTLFLSCKKEENPLLPDISENTNPIVIADSWSLFSTPPAVEIRAMSKSNDGILYSGIRDGIRSGLVRSSDNGLSWEQIYKGGVPTSVYISPIDGMIILSLGGPFTTTTVYSKNNGVNWEYPIQQPRATVNSYLALPTGQILAGGTMHDESQGGVIISHDKGVTWEHDPILGKDLSVVSFALNSVNDVYTLVAHPMINNNRLTYFSVIYKSKDQGQTWLEISKFDTLSVYNLTIDKNDNLFINTNKGLFFSSENNLDWKSSKPLTHNEFIYEMLIDSEDNLVLTLFDFDNKKTTVLLLTASRDKWYSIDGLSLPSFEFPISTLISNDNYIYLTTSNKGMFKTKFTINELLNSK